MQACVDVILNEFDVYYKMNQPAYLLQNDWIMSTNQTYMKVIQLYANKMMLLFYVTPIS